MNIQEIVAILVNSGISPNEANIEVKMMIEHYCNYSALDIVRGVKLDYEKLKVVQEKAQVRARTKLPIQYIMGVADFMGNKYVVNENVLIPRCDTEHLVLRAIDLIRSHNLNKVLEIGTGTGCISCAIAQSTNSDVTSVDISANALKVAHQNVMKLGLENRVKLIESDLFSNIADYKFDLIVSNPPYIPFGTELQKEVTFEPKIALFADDEGLEYYKKIIPKAKEYLNDKGFLAFEIGSTQGCAVYDLMHDAGYTNIMIENDLSGLNRNVYGQLKL